MKKYDDNQIENLRKQVKEGEDIKAVVRMKQWKETVIGRIMRMKDEITQKGYCNTDPITGHLLPPRDAGAKANHMVATIDLLLQGLQVAIEQGEQAKQELKQSDNIPPQGSA